MTEPIYVTHPVASLTEALEYCLKLRRKKFWSFRGQRKREWTLGLHGIDSPDKLDVHRRQFIRRCMEFPPPHYIKESDKWRWLFFAQHHRLKTRLLDWTKDPSVAIYFAVENILSGKNDNEDYGAIWALHVTPENFMNADELKNKRAEEITKWIMLNPPPVTPRLARQSGLFTFHGGANCLKQLDELPRRPGEKLVKIEIVEKGGENPTKQIRQELGILNVHHASLFPDPEGIAQFVNLEWPIIAADMFESGEMNDEKRSKNKTRPLRSRSKVAERRPKNR